jgi:hypothetical protein
MPQSGRSLVERKANDAEAVYHTLGTHAPFPVAARSEYPEMEAIEGAKDVFLLYAEDDGWLL